MDDRVVDLGTVTKDMDLQLVRYPIARVIVKGIGPDGRALPSFIPHLEYANATIQIDRPYYTNGVVGIEMNETSPGSGSWRANQVLPDEGLVVSGTAPGYAPASTAITTHAGEQTVTLHMSKQ